MKCEGRGATIKYSHDSGCGCQCRGWMKVVLELHQGPRLYSELGLVVSASTTWACQCHEHQVSEWSNTKSKILWSQEMLSALETRTGDKAWWQVHVVMTGRHNTSHAVMTWVSQAQPRTENRWLELLVISDSLKMTGWHWPRAPLWLCNVSVVSEICDDNLLAGM